MSARMSLAVLVLLAACTPAVPSIAIPAPSPTVDAATLAKQCEGHDGWSDPAPPATLFANVHYVGTCGITALLITSPQGHVLIDGATTQAADGIAANVEKLGYKLSDVRLILSSHEHLDHAGGIAELQRRTGAKLVARTAAKATLESGIAEPEDPQSGLFPAFPGAHVGQIVGDGEIVRLGPLAFTAHATPAHSPGSTSWSWTSCAAKDCRNIVYADSLTAVSADGYRFSDHPALIARFRRSFDTVSALPCDLLLTPHPGASAMFDRFAGRAPLFDSRACQAYAATGSNRLDVRLAKEAASAP